MKNFNIQYSIFDIQHSGIAVVFAALVLNGLAVQAEPPAARTAFDGGVKAFAASNFAAAADSFIEAAATAPAEKLDPAAAHYNAGLSAQAAGDIEGAARHFAHAAGGGDLGLQAKAYYNRGNALFHLADMPLQAQALPGGAPAPALDTSESAIGEAIQMYENAIALDPDDADAKANYELAVLKQQQIQQQKQEQQDQQQQDKEEGDPEPQPQPESGDSEEEQEEQEPQPQPQPEDQPSAAESQEDSDPPPPQPQESPEDMTPEEAEMLLDALKAQEQSQRDRLQPFFGRPVPVEKDW